MSGRGILDANMRTLAQWMAQGLQWWLTQLRDMAPGWLTKGLAGAAPACHYDPHAGAFSPAPGMRRWCAMLPSGLALARSIALPRMSASALDRMVALEADRLLPFADAQAVVAARSMTQQSDDPARQTVVVAGLSAAAASALAQAILAQPTLPLQVLVPLEQGAAVDILSAMVRVGLLPDERARARLWWVAALALFALNLGLIVWRDVAALEQVDAGVAAQQPALTVARRITARIRANDRVALTVMHDRAQGEPLQMMARAGAALPPGVWLQRWGWQGDTLHLVGLRPVQADVSGALRAAGFATLRYADSAGDATTQESATAAATPLGTPFDIIVRLPGFPAMPQEARP
jgi:general secretion pathway protein L